MDSFFTSIALFKSLLNDGIYACGTIRHNRRDFPDDLKEKKNTEIKKCMYVLKGVCFVNYMHFQTQKNAFTCCRKYK